jgi:hypothetical protein
MTSNKLDAIFAFLTEEFTETPRKGHISYCGLIYEVTMLTISIGDGETLSVVSIPRRSRFPGDESDNSTLLVTSQYLYLQDFSDKALEGQSVFQMKKLQFRFDINEGGEVLFSSQQAENILLSDISIATIKGMTNIAMIVLFKIILSTKLFMKENSKELVSHT